MYSQNQEERIIGDYFRGFVGTFLDLGANDGETFSNTRRLALDGWRGVLIEPSPKAFSRLYDLYDPTNVKNEDKFLLYNMAVGSETKEVVLKESGHLIHKGDIALVSTLHAEEQKRFQNSVEYTDIEVQCRRWEEVEGYLKMTPKFKHIDFISMDIEGSELEVLPQMDLSETKCICIEWNSKPELQTEYEKYLGGFKLRHVNQENLIYVR